MTLTTAHGSSCNRTDSVSLRLVGLLATLTALALVVTPVPSYAHDELIGSAPEEGVVLSEAPTAVTLTFEEQVLGQGGAIVVTDPNDIRYDDPSTLQIVGATASIQLKPGANSGTFTVSYRIVASDGHVGEGSFTYRVGTANDEPRRSDTPAVVQGDTSASGLWVLGLGAIGLALVAAIVVVFTRRRRD